MAKKKKMSLANKLGKKGADAVAKHREDEIKLSSGGGLPAGIENGIARLEECKFDVYKKGTFEGEYFFLANATVIEPHSHEGIPIKGLKTQIGPEPICDTPESGGKKKTVDDHIEWVMNEMRKLGIDTTELGIDDLETAAEALKEEAPVFRFRTWSGQPTEQYPNPKVNHDWRGLVEEYEEEDAAEEHVQDDTGEEEAAEEEQEEATSEEEMSLSDLGELADAEDEESKVKLSEMAEEVGISTDDYDTWSDVAKALEEGGEDSSEEEVVPEEEDVFWYRPPRKRARVECEVIAVDEDTKTCTLKNLKDEKEYEKVSWDELFDSSK